MEKQFYSEEQKFSPMLVWLIMFPVWMVVNVIFGIGLYQQIGTGQPWGDKPMSDMGLIALTAVINLIVIGTAMMIIKTRMVVEIRETGFVYRYPPFIIKEKMIPREEIDRFEVRQYKPIQEYGGWGFRQQRRRFRNAGLAYNVSGNIGLQLYLKNGKKILFGTQRKEAIGSAMNKMMGGRE